MATNENLIPIPGRLHSVASEGHVAGADEIFDDSLNKDQATINQEVNEAIGTGGSVDSRIAAAVNVEKTRAEGAESTLTTNLGNEVTRATNAENALDGRVDTLEGAVGTGGSVDSRISDAVSTETTRAQGAETALDGRITPLEQAVGTGGNIDQRIADATKDAAFIDASEQGSENVNW